MLDGWETDGGWPAQRAITPTQHGIEWAQKLDSHINANSQLASSMLTLNQMTQQLRALSEETKKLLRPLTYLHPQDRLRIGIFADLKTFVCEPCNDSPNGLIPAIGIDGNVRRWQDRIPASRRDDKQRLLAPATDFTVVVLSAMWGDNRITFSDEAAKNVYMRLAIQWKLYFMCAEMQANYKAKGELTPLAQSFPDPPGYTVAPYQRCAAACAAIVPGYNLWMKPGTGKSLVTITAMDYLIRRHAQLERTRLEADSAYHARPFRAFITCPKGVRINWLEELRKFSTVNYRAALYQGNWMQRNKHIIDATCTPSALVDANGADAVILVSSYGLMRQDQTKLTITATRKFQDGVIVEPYWDLGVMDESHYLANRKAKQSQKALKFRDSFARRFGLTGTQQPNSVSDVYTQFEWIGEAFSGFQSQKQFDKFFKRFIEIDVNDGAMTVQREIETLNAPLIKERTARMCFTITKEEALPDLPPKRYTVHGVTMTPEQTRVYERALNSIIVSAEQELGGFEGDGRNYQMVLQNVLKKLTRLTQITSGFYVTDPIYDDDGRLLQPKEIHRFDPNAKLEALIPLLKDLPSTSKAIIAACWQQDIRTISARMAAEGLPHVLYYGPIKDDQRERNLHAFNTSREIQFLVGNPATFGIGRNINGQADEYTNCDNTFIYSQGYSSPIREQLEDRNNRLGTRVSGLYTDLMVYGTVDQDIREKVMGKRTNQMSMSDVRQIMFTLAANLHVLREAA